MRMPTEEQNVVGVLLLLAVWLFFGLPLLYGQPSHYLKAAEAQSYNAASQGAKNLHPEPGPTEVGTPAEARDDEGTEYWPTFLGLRLKITDSLLATFTLGLLIFTGLLWRSTDKLWAAGERALTTTERAFFFIDGFNVEQTTLADAQRDEASEMHLSEQYKSDPGLYITRFALQPRWKNGGTTPTVDLTIQVDWRAPGSPLPADFSYRSAPRPFFLGPQTIETSDYVDMQGAQTLVNWSWNPIPPAPMMFVWGRADYRDVFGKRHSTEWCYQLRFSRPIRSERLRAEFIQWGEYNRIDRSS